MEKFIGQEFQVKGFNEPRVVKIVRLYYLGGKKKYPAFECQVVGNYSHFKDGDRENFLVKDVVKSGQLVKNIKVLSA